MAHLTRENIYSGTSPESFGFKRIIYQKSGYKATVTINRQEALNCFDYQTLIELGQAFLDVSNDDAIAVLVITGAGERAFCTGADLKEQEDFLKKPNDYHKWFYAFLEMHDRLRNIGKATVARLNGMVVGGGNELNMACDLAIAADHVTIKQVGAARGSVAAGGATQWLPLIIGDRRAREMLLLCENIDAYTALEWGLVNQVVPASMLDTAVDALAEKLRDKLPECTRYTKQQLNFWRDFSWSMTIGHARDWLTLHAGSKEVKHGLDSFRRKAEMDYQSIRADRGANSGTERGGRGTRESAKETEEHSGASESAKGTTCTGCSEEIPAENVYCGKCGKKIEE